MITALALAEHIAEGYGRYTGPEQRQLYRAARRDLLRLETQLAVARQADVLSAGHLAQLSHRAQLVGRLLGGYLVYLDRQLAQPDGASPDSARAPIEPVDEVHGAEPGQRGGPGTDNPLRGARQVGRRGEVEHVGHVAARRTPGSWPARPPPISRTRSMTRLRFGAPPAAKLRLRCSRVTPSASASAAVRTGRPACWTRYRHASSWRGLVEAERFGGAPRAAAKRIEYAWRNTSSRMASSSTSSTRTSANSSDAHWASTGPSAARSVVRAKNGTLGYSRANAAARQLSSWADPTSTIAASTSSSRKRGRTRPPCARTMSAPAAPGKACRAPCERVRSRGAKTRTVATAGPPRRDRA